MLEVVDEADIDLGFESVFHRRKTVEMEETKTKEIEVDLEKTQETEIEKG